MGKKYATTAPNRQNIAALSPDMINPEKLAPSHLHRRLFVAAHQMIESVISSWRFGHFCLRSIAFSDEASARRVSVARKLLDRCFDRAFGQHDT